MSEVEGVHNGNYNYSQLEGATGPLVYPGGFVVVYYVLYLATSFGENIELAQYLFMGLYMLFILTCMLIYKESKTVPMWAILLLCVSRRIHSIFVLRLFNDCWSIFFLYISILCFIKNKWNIGCVIYSFAVGIKMNIFLFAPGLFVLLLIRFGMIETMKKIVLYCGSVQLILGLPFIYVDLLSYLNRAFDLRRVFIYYWSVNWKFVPEDIFLNAYFGLSLLLVTLSFWFIFALSWNKMKKWNENPQNHNLQPSYIVSVLFISNFIGVVFSRSLHYQFYVWYFHTIPHLLWCTKLPLLVKGLIMVLIEVSWNVFPSNWWSSALLFGCHLVLLIALLISCMSYTSPAGETTLTSKQKKHN
eukprot:TRINITY_DN2877_c0_g1_i1.p1 TRINITY_DN2877_c0_g1~~TRINITY_DN2877_c0_g1_i1.p1  ORF type:complete len:411 (-),score=28.58 TRINITY_DN2877_c0_g1_i1:208-1281(-)